MSNKSFERLMPQRSFGVFKMSKGSLTGYNFLYESPNCWRKFYLSKVLNLEPEHPPYYFPFGTAIHEGMEAFYSDGFDEAKLTTTFEDSMDESYKLFDREQFNELVSTGKSMINHWVNKWAEHDRRTYEVVETEVEHEKDLPNSHLFTFKIDRVLRNKETRVEYIFDTKTTQSSVTRTYHTARLGDQATAYLWGYEKAVAFVVDILYKKGRVTDCQRYEIVRTKQDIQAFLSSTMNKTEYISNAVAAVEQGGDPFFYFPRHGGYSCQFSCPFSDICRNNIPTSYVPVGFKRKEQ